MSRREVDGSRDTSVQRPAIRGFTVSQRRALSLLVALFLFATIVGLLRERSYVPDPLPDEAARYSELLATLDPNVASARELSAIPNLGPRRAADIVAYRERVQQREPSRVAFRVPNDLLRVDGVGASILQQSLPYLSFPGGESTIAQAKTRKGSIAPDGRPASAPIEGAGLP